MRYIFSIRILTPQAETSSSQLIPNCVSVSFQSLESSRFKIKPCVTVGFDCYLPEDMCSMYLLKLPVGVTRVECRGTSDLN